MAFRPLTDSECGQTNPLMQLTTHLTRDHTFAESHGPATVFPNSSDQLVEQFLQETRVLPQTFRVDDLMREMHEIESQRAAMPPIPASQVKDHLNDDTWALEYIGEQNFDRIVDPKHEVIWAEISATERDQIEVDSQIDWAAQFQHLEEQQEEAEVVQQRANELLDSVDDPKFAYSKFMKFIKQVGSGKVNIEDGNVKEQDGETWSDEYLGAVARDGTESLGQTWADEYAAPTTSKDDGYNSQFWTKLQDEWKKLAEEETGEEHPWASEFNDIYDPYKEYEFTEDNPIFDVNNPLERGKEMLERGDLPGAVLCFEAAVKKDANSIEAWLLLGTTQAENEQDPKAICAIKQCLQLQPDNLMALMALAVSYTNENYHNQACRTLISWLRHNPKYKDVVPPDFRLSGQVTSFIDPEQHKAVQELFLRAAQQQPLDPDYEVQCGLGVLFNLSGEYDKAVDCFRVALGVKPDDSRLWNRLGATLANGSKPEEAVEAYHHALNLAPGFIRARYNVGITCINLRAYKEAAEHFLIALNQQAGGRDITATSGNNSQMSETIWSTLKMCIHLMNRSDLRTYIDNRDLNALNKTLGIHDE